MRKLIKFTVAVMCTSLFAPFESTQVDATQSSCTFAHFMPNAEGIHERVDKQNVLALSFGEIIPPILGNLAYISKKEKIPLALISGKIGIWDKIQSFLNRGFDLVLYVELPKNVQDLISENPELQTAFATRGPLPNPSALYDLILQEYGSRRAADVLLMDFQADESTVEKTGKIASFFSNRKEEIDLHLQHDPAFCGSDITFADFIHRLAQVADQAKEIFYMRDLAKSIAAQRSENGHLPSFTQDFPCTVLENMKLVASLPIKDSASAIPLVSGLLSMIEFYSNRPLEESLVAKVGSFKASAAKSRGS